MKYVILGNGYVGNYLAKTLPNATLYPQKLTETYQIKELMLKYFPSHTLINCAGKTGKPNVDWCERNKEATFDGNVNLPLMIAEACKEIKQPWVHIGSGCIYNGYDKEFTEEDEPNFDGSYYARTKAWSQDLLKGYDEVLILRIRMPIDDKLSERNYITKIVSYARQGRTLYDLPNSMTILSDLAGAIQHLTEQGSTGTYNVVNKGGMTISEILRLYRQYVDPLLEYKITSYEEVRSNLVADRSNCILSCQKLQDDGFEMPLLEGRIVDIMKGLRGVA